MEKRLLKDILYEQVSRIGKAVSSPKRLELLNLLAQGEKTVEALTTTLQIDVKLTSAHLKTLKESRLVTARRDGRFMIYALAGDDVARLLIILREVAQKHLFELKAALEQMNTTPDKLVGFSRESLLEQARQGKIFVIDVRPRDEYEAAHLPYARSIPLEELEQRIAELPHDSEIVAYCRGPFCMLSHQATELLAAKGYQVRKMSEGVLEWQAAGLPVEYATAS